MDNLMDDPFEDEPKRPKTTLSPTRSTRRKRNRCHSKKIKSEKIKKSENGDIYIEEDILSHPINTKLKNDPNIYDNNLIVSDEKSLHVKVKDVTNDNLRSSISDEEIDSLPELKCSPVRRNKNMDKSHIIKTQLKNLKYHPKNFYVLTDGLQKVYCKSVNPLGNKVYIEVDSDEILHIRDCHKFSSIIDVDEKILNILSNINGNKFEKIMLKDKNIFYIYDNENNSIICYKKENVIQDDNLIFNFDIVPIIKLSELDKDITLINTNIFIKNVREYVKTKNSDLHFEIKENFNNICHIFQREKILQKNNRYFSEDNRISNRLNNLLNAYIEGNTLSVDEHDNYKKLLYNKYVREKNFFKSKEEYIMLEKILHRMKKNIDDFNLIIETRNILLNDIEKELNGEL